MEINQESISNWLIEKFAYKMGYEKEDVDKDMLFVDFGVDSTEVLMLAGELEDWIGFELSPTAMWYHPTISKLAIFIEEEFESLKT